MTDYHLKFISEQLTIAQTKLGESYSTQGSLIGLLGMALIHLDKGNYDIFMDNIKQSKLLPEDVKERLAKYKQ